jgi:hypothetical protein
MNRWRASLASAAWLLAVTLATRSEGAKRSGFSSPGGRTLYDAQDDFSIAVEGKDRRFVAEVALGAGPEGNLGMLLGWQNQPFRGVAWYLGVGFEFNPARHYTGTVRYVFDLDGYRPFVAAGYVYNDLYELRTYSHNAFVEVGYSWILHQTYHVAVGVGARHIVHLGIRPDSPLHAGDIDPALLAVQRDSLSAWMPTLAFRFSRAF